MSTKGITTTVAVIGAIVTLVVGLVIGLFAAPVVLQPTVGLSGEVKLGAILSLTGDLATFGENEQLAAEFAAEHVNALLEDMGADWTLVIVPEDTQTDPDIALEKVESLAARGIEFIIGPLSSAEVRAIKGYADANKILVISQSSTAPDMAIADDYIFRFCPTDKGGQGPAIGRIMYDDGKTHIIPVTRNDAWGIGLKEAAKTKFEALGGTFLESIDYDPEAAEFTTEAALLASKVDSAITTYGADKVAVLNIAFEEVVAFMTASMEHDVLDDVYWYGSDGTATSAAMTADADVKSYAISVGYPCTIFAPTQSEKWEMVHDHGIAELGRDLDSYSYAIYDIVWAYALSLLAVDKYDAEAVKEVLPTITETMFGASGWITLDQAGDREAGNYDIWQITATAQDWEITGQYILASDTVEWA